MTSVSDSDMACLGRGSRTQTSWLLQSVVLDGTSDIGSTEAMVFSTVLAASATGDSIVLGNAVLVCNFKLIVPGLF